LTEGKPSISSLRVQNARRWKRFFLDIQTYVL
jgi:hypothetical protein